MVSSMTDHAVIDLGYGLDEDELAELEEREQAEARAAADLEEEEYGSDVDLSPEMEDFVDQLIKRSIMFCEELAGFKLRPHQGKLGYRIIESLIIEDVAEITALMARQGGKSETIATILSGCMVLFPKLAKVYPILEKFKDGLMVGLFAPVETQSKLLFDKFKLRLTSQRADVVLEQPEINEKVKSGASEIHLKNGSFCRRQTANPQAKIDGASYHIVVIDEAQAADKEVVRRAIHPMLAAYAGTIVKIGTPGYEKGDFYEAIHLNKATLHRGRRKRVNHFEFDHKEISKHNAAYGKYIQEEKRRLGEDSEEFQMSYCLKWQLDRGMLITDEELDALGDTSMQLVKSWSQSPVVVGIDVARIKDSTVVTVCWVNWDNPDAAGYKEIRILNWLEINNTAWEEQHWEIIDFLRPYRIHSVGIDGQGMGSAVAERLDRDLARELNQPGIEVNIMNSDPQSQSERWKHLIQLLQRHMLGYPNHSKARRTRCWKKFYHQMSSVQKVMKGKYIAVAAPEERQAFDDYVDSLAIAAYNTAHDVAPRVEVVNSPFYQGRSRRR